MFSTVAATVSDCRDLNAGVMCECLVLLVRSKCILIVLMQFDIVAKKDTN